MKTHPTLERAWAVAIILLAAFLRFYRLDWVEYKLDEAMLSRLALNMVRYGQMPLWGLGSSVGVYNGALPAWLLALPYTLSASPVVATGFVAALNVLAVALTYAFTRRIAGGRAALLAALLFATAPWAVLNSRKLWAQDLLPPFIIAYLWTAYHAFCQKKHAWLIGHAAALAACIQLHYSALTLAPLSALYGIIFWGRRWPGRITLAACAVGLLSFGPFLYHDAITAEPNTGLFPNITRIVETAWQRPAVIDTAAVQMAWIMITGHDLHSLAGPAGFRHYLDSVWPIAPFFTVLGGLVMGALGWTLVQAWCAWPQPIAQAGLLVALAILFPILAFTRHSTPVYPHYFILLYPWPFVLVGMLIDRLRRWRVAGIVLVIALAQMYGYFSITHFVAGRATPNGYGTPVGLTLNAVRAAEQAARARQGGLVIYAAGDNIAADEVAATWDVLVDPIFAPRIVDRRQAQIYPAGPVMYVQAGDEWPVPADATPIALRAGELRYWLFSTNAPPLTASVSLANTMPWSNGARLLAAHAEWSAAALRWQITWRVERTPPPGADYHWFNHLLDAAGQRVAQADGVGLATRNWRAGDVISAWFDIPLTPALQPGLYIMRVGMYTFPDLQNVPVVDVAGNPAADALTIGPFELTGP
jgi:4-amino-4-deoxy-L-arabinose transferase-like glycosyltransferase